MVITDTDTVTDTLSGGRMQQVQPVSEDNIVEWVLTKMALRAWYRLATVRRKGWATTSSPQHNIVN